MPPTVWLDVELLSGKWLKFLHYYIAPIDARIMLSKKKNKKTKHENKNQRQGYAITILVNYWDEKSPKFLTPTREIEHFLEFSGDVEKHPVEDAKISKRKFSGNVLKSFEKLFI